MESMAKVVNLLSQRFITGWEVSGDHQDAGLGEFETLVLPFMNRLYRTALMLTGSPRVAKDLLHVTCLQARHGYRRFHSDDDFGNWIFRILFDAFWLNRHRVEFRQADLSNPSQNGELSPDFLCVRSPKNDPAKYPFGEMTLPPACA